LALAPVTRSVQTFSKAFTWAQQGKICLPFEVSRTNVRGISHQTRGVYSLQ
jgi:hypothetical protein